MKRDLLNSSIAEFLSELSGKKNVPGGGSVAAVAAVLGAGLNLMVIRYTLGRDAQKTDFLADLETRQEESKKQLALFVDEDANVFEALMAKISSKNVSDNDYKDAANIPVKVCRECYSSMKITDALKNVSNKNLITDIGCASYVLKAAFLSAELNIEINLAYVEDKEYVNSVREEIKGLKDDICVDGKKIQAYVTESLK